MTAQRDLAPTAMRIDLSISSQHDLLAREGAATHGAWPRGFLDDDLSIRSGHQSIGLRPRCGALATCNAGARPQEHQPSRSSAPKGAVTANQLARKSVPGLARVRSRACRMSERGTTGTPKSSTVTY